MTEIRKTVALSSANNQRNKIQISFHGTEFDYCAIKSDGILDFGRNYCGIIWNDVYDIEVEVNDLTFTDVCKIKVNTLPMQIFDFEKEIVGIRMFENKSQYYCEIETDEDFCIDKLEINLYTCQLKIDNIITEPYSDTTMFSTIVYNGVEYPLSCGVSNCKGSDLVWGVDPMMLKIRKRTIKRLVNILEYAAEQNPIPAEDTMLTSSATPEDVVAGVKDEYDAVYSSDGLRLLSMSNFDIETYAIKQGVKVVCDWAFCNCQNLKSIDIPNSVELIGKNAFEKCNMLMQVSLPNSIKEIDTGAFRSCENLRHISIPNGISTIESDTFRGCISLRSVELPNSVTVIDSGAFSYCKMLRNISLPNTIEVINNWAFSNCSSLTKVVIPSSVITLGVECFAYCNKLEHITLSNSITTIEDSAFRDCKILKEIVLPESVTNIESWVFKNCISLQKVTILNPAPAMKEEIFVHCSNLQEIIVPKGSKSYFENVLDNKLKAILKEVE